MILKSQRSMPNGKAGDEYFWKKAGEKRFPYKGFLDFSVAAIGLPMDSSNVPRIYTQMFFQPDGTGSERRVRDAVEHARGELADLIGAPTDRLYFSVNTYGAIEMVLRSLHLPNGSDMLITTDEYIQFNRLMQNFTSGINLIEVSTDGNLIDRIERAITPQTKAIVTSHITHETCMILPVKEISDLARRHNIPYIIDGAQSVGQIPVDISQIAPTAYVGCGHKWLRGTTVSGFAYAEPGFNLETGTQFHFSPPVCGTQVSPYLDQWIDPNLGNAQAIAHLGITLSKLKKYGWNNIFERIRYLGEVCRELLGQIPNVEVLMPENAAPGMIPIRIKGITPDKLNEYLSSKKIQATAKTDITRISVSPFNTVHELFYLSNAIGNINGY